MTQVIREPAKREITEDYLFERYGNHTAATILKAAQGMEKSYEEAEQAYLKIREWMIFNGFNHISTGGGCSAWIKNMCYSDILITDLDGTNEAIFLDEKCYVGSYTKDGDWLECHELYLCELIEIW